MFDFINNWFARMNSKATFREAGYKLVEHDSHHFGYCIYCDNELLTIKR